MLKEELSKWAGSQDVCDDIYVLQTVSSGDKPDEA